MVAQNADEGSPLTVIASFRCQDVVEVDYARKAGRVAIVHFIKRIVACCQPSCLGACALCCIIRNTMDANLIQSDPSVMMGKPVIAGTRITVELILEKLAAEESVEQILADHPRLTKDAISAALAYAAQALRNLPPQKAA